MDNILKLKKDILNGKNIAENYKELSTLVNEKKKNIELIKSKINKDTNKKNQCDDISIIQNKIDSLNNKDILDSNFVSDYREILSNINYLNDYYNNNTTIIKKISLEGTKVSLKKI